MSRFGDLGGRLYRGDFSFNIVGNKRLWYSVSAGLIVLALVGLLVRGLNLGIEFKGGAEFYVPSASCEIQDVREAVADTGVEAAAVTEIGSQNIRAQTAAVTPEQGRAIVDALATTCDVSADQVSSRDVGPTWGGEITRTALIGLAVFLSLLAVFLTVYFQWKMAVAALVALAHDIVITAGIYALVGFEVTPATVIGLLTILGFSLYDTVVVFDKVRENTKGITGQSRYTYSELANLALNQTIIRSINTSIVALLPVASILFVGAFLLGAGALKDLALVLFIGTAVGTYSSIFVATPVLCQMEEREPAMKALAARVMKRRAARGEAPTPGGTAPAESQKAAVGSDAGGVATAVDRPHRQHRDAGTRVQPKRQSRSKRKH
ncbi:MAG: protein translocase subunit SecF [Actinobacteria bacterium]|mgnify:CR=1 FL=1|nr:protein translocase subunit SecF [Actinomycetota bacterium]MCB8995902.1 protein translocase subunit SecF [Actinomycetota bacterium]MCB9415139.1 protein translocase subunit SecF [Actinomycetota bacterium]MCB9424619.1 protein translocase subunit SecF [Actinomycetota bacterium]HRY08509.1 protein translocase subunit SecF [Candidatus Nanopelagicales bacterium]